MIFIRILYKNSRNITQKGEMEKYLKVGVVLQLMSDQMKIITKFESEIISRSNSAFIPIAFETNLDRIHLWARELSSHSD